jgi:hypothetical protein
VRLDVVVRLIRARNAWRRNAGPGDARGVGLDVVAWLVRARDSWRRNAGPRDARGVGLDFVAWLHYARDAWRRHTGPGDARGVSLDVGLLDLLLVRSLLVSHLSSFQGDRISVNRRSSPSKSSLASFKNAIVADILSP